MFMPWTLFILFSHVAIMAQANTEIVNFPGGEILDGISIPSPVAQWPALNWSNNELQWSITPAPLETPLKLVCEPNYNSQAAVNGSSAPRQHCPHELWVTLDTILGGWDAYNKFTLRISWPASHPTDFLIDIFDPENLAAHFPGVSSYWAPYNTRRTYARIRAVNIGVPTPAFKTLDLKAVASEQTLVPFIVILEPLYFGVLPASVIPVLVFILFVCVLASLVVPRVNQCLQKIAAQARKDILRVTHTTKHD